MTLWLSIWLKRAGNVLLTIGVLLLLSRAFQFFRSAALQSPSPSTSHQASAINGNDVAERIPYVLDQIYKALDKGRPQEAAPFLSVEMMKSAQSLDYICQPFTHRAHYVASIIVRPDGTVMARERVVYKPFREQARLLWFKESGGSYFLYSAQDDPFTQEREEAKEAVRQFIFAARAERWDLVRQYASPGLPIETLQDSAWQAYVANIRGAKIDRDPEIQRNDDGVLVLTVEADLQAHSWATDFVVDPSTGKIVTAFYTYRMGWMWATSGAPDKDGFSDPNIKNEALARFGLPHQSTVAPIEAGLSLADQDIADPTSIEKPVILQKVEPEFTAEARRTRFSGDVHVSIVVTDQGHADQIQITDSPGLGLDEKIKEALHQWRFKPALKDGVPVSAKAMITISFKQM